MDLSVKVESPLQDDVRQMVSALDGFSNALAPAEANYHMTAEEMSGTDVTVFIVRDVEEAPIGMGCLMTHDDGVGEVKRMWSDPARRGEGIGHTVLGAIIERARISGLRELVLETGAAAEYEPAWRLYERAGFISCGPVLDYPPSQHSRYYRKALTS